MLIPCFSLYILADKNEILFTEQYGVFFFFLLIKRYPPIITAVDTHAAIAKQQPIHCTAVC